MSIEAQLNDAMKRAMRSGDKDRLACIRQLKSKVQEAANAKDFTGVVDDALYQRVIESYVKSLRKGLAELEGAGERGEALRNKYQGEIDYLSEFLPQKLAEAETRALVQQAVADTGAREPREAGRVMGVIMKAHKDAVDPALVRRLVDEELAGASS